MKRLVAIVFMILIVGSTTLFAQKGKKQKGKSKETTVSVVFVDTQREAARSYFVTQHGKGHCPPGLAKKNNGCLPPGQAKKRYVIGQPLPHGIVVAEVPVELSVKIGRAPAGYRYGILDGDLVKLAVGTMLVVDAIDGMVR